MIVPPDAASAPDHGRVRAFESAFFLLPAADCEIVDDLFVCGLSGTGSKDIVVRDAFVPAHRVLPFSDMRAGTTAGGRYHRNPIYRMPLLMLGASMLAPAVICAWPNSRPCNCATPRRRPQSRRPN